MVEDDTPNKDDGLEPLPAVPSHDPLPLPPDISFIRPTLGHAAPPRQQESSGEQRAQLSQGVQGYGLAITAAITLALTLLIFIGLGQWLDHRYNAAGTPWFTIVGLLVGIVGGFGSMIRLLTSASKK